MAITAATMTSDFSGFLTPDESAPIFDEAVRQSAFQQLFRRVPLGINGQKIPVVTSKPTANWTGQGQKKHGTSMGLGLATLDPKKLTAMAVASAEVIRANPGSYAELLHTQLAGAFATAFDLAVAYNVGGDGTGNGPFEDYLAETTKSIEIGTTTQANGGVHGDIVAGLSLLTAAKSKLTGFAFDDAAEPLFWGAVDSTGRPLYVDLPTDQSAQAVMRPGRLLNRPSFMGEGVGRGTTLGFGGDFTKGAWGVVGGISFRVSTEAAVTINGELTSAFENNLVVILAEAEYGFTAQDVNKHFVKYANATP